MGKLIDLLLWLAVTLFSPKAGLNEIEDERGE
jgi:hypothetical protein